MKQFGTTFLLILYYVLRHIFYQYPHKVTPDDYLLARRLHAFIRTRVFRTASLVALYGAGRHTERLLQVGILPPERIAVVFDDNPSFSEIAGIPVCSPKNAPRMEFDLLLISSDSSETTLLDRARTWIPEDIPVMPLYDR